MSHILGLTTSSHIACDYRHKHCCCRATVTVSSYLWTVFGKCACWFAGCCCAPPTPLAGRLHSGRKGRELVLKYLPLSFTGDPVQMQQECGHSGEGHPRVQFEPAWPFALKCSVWVDECISVMVVIYLRRF